MFRKVDRITPARHLMETDVLQAFIIVFYLTLTIACPSVIWGAENSARPKVRAITAFIRLDRNKYEAQIQDTLRMLRRAKSAMEQGGYEVESIRITTQPFPEYIRGLSK